MKLLRFFRKKRPSKKRTKRTSVNKVPNTLKADIKNISTQLEAVYIILCRHDQHINENSLYIKM